MIIKNVHFINRISGLNSLLKTSLSSDFFSLLYGVSTDAVITCEIWINILCKLQNCRCKTGNCPTTYNCNIFPFHQTFCHNCNCKYFKNIVAYNHVINFVKQNFSDNLSTIVKLQSFRKRHRHNWFDSSFEVLRKIQFRFICFGISNSEDGKSCLLIRFQETCVAYVPVWSVHWLKWVN